MADVTNEVLVTEGLYKLREGDTVDFGSLLAKIHEKYKEWHGVDGANDRDAEYCQVLLISGGLVFDIGIDFLDKAMTESVNGVSQTFIVYVDLVANWQFDDTELSGYSMGGSYRVMMPRLVSMRTVLVKSDHGESCLDGIVIKYPDEVPLADRLSA
ncbi:MAG: hypothetical protein EOO18_02750 [Chryseobacterium sp.]|nr:MAG: hypothetical protein EOO18_02750 [Chryseobacterium sp.]